MKTLWLIAVAAMATCKVHVTDGTSDEAGAFPCKTSDSCPAPETGCLLATCMDGQCVFVPAPDGVLPEEDQLTGDCKQLFCDGEGETIAYPSQFDLPVKDGNPCTAAVCDLDVAKQEPRVAGTRCPTPASPDGVCNGAGKCGVCVPEVERCDGQAVVTCTADGQWSDAVACATDKPVCARGVCVGMTAVDAGADHTCARFDDGTVRCWGNDDRGQLGGSGLSAARSPAWASGFTSMHVGKAHQCGIRTDGTVWCWGAGELGQLGDGARRSSPLPVATGVTAIAVDVGDHHSCALEAAGTVKCWGRNDFGQLGTGRAPAAPLAITVPTRGRKAQPAAVLIAALTDAGTLDVDGDHTCVIRKGGQRACWGLPVESAPTVDEDDDAAEPSAEVKQATLAKPMPVVGVSDAVELGCGDQHCCVRRRNGEVSCWGGGDRGALGTGTAANSFSAVPVAGVRGAKQIGVGSHFACAWLADSSVMCWGANDRGQLGTGATETFDTAKLVATLGKVTSLAVADESVCVLAESGQLICWGDNRAGQLGLSGVAMTREPLPLAWP